MAGLELHGDEDDDGGLASLMNPFDQELRVAVCGNVDAGKSTCVGVLVNHKLDDGRGAVRSSVMRYPHEVDTGRTSAVVQHTIFEFPQQQGRRVTLVDLAGHEKYLRTTIYGFNSGLIDVACVLVNARKGPLGTTRHHLELAANLHTPVVVCVSKVDGCPPDVLAQTGKDLAKLLKKLFPSASIKPLKRLLLGPSATSATSATDQSHPTDQALGRGNASKESLGPSSAKLAELGLAMPQVIPVLPVSFVTGEGVDRLRRFLFALNPKSEFAKHANESLEFVSDGLYQPPGVGAVLSGFVLRGTAKVGETVQIGPRPDGSFLSATVRSIHRDRSLTPDAPAGTAACLAVAVSKNDRRFLRRGLAVLSAGSGVKPALGVWEFDARLFVVRGSSATLRIGYQPFAHIVMVRQSVSIVSVKVERQTSEDGAAEEDPEAQVETGDVNPDLQGADTGLQGGVAGAPQLKGATSQQGGEAKGEAKDEAKGEAKGEAKARQQQVMHSGEMGVVRFRFLRRPEFVRPGMRIMLREGKMRSVGEIL